MRPSHLSYAFLGSFVLTIFALQWWQEPSYPPLLTQVLGLALILCVIGCILTISRAAASLLLSILIGSSIAFFVVARTTHVPTTATIDSYANGNEIAIHGFIVDEPDRRALATKYTVEAAHIMVNGKEQKVHGKVLVTYRNHWPEFSYGDEVIVTGVLERPGVIEDFTYDRYLSRYGIYSVIYRSNIEKLSSGHESKLFSFLFSVKARFERQIQRLYPEPHASLMAGLLTGSRRGIPEYLLEKFNATGLTHLIAISGFNITIVITFITGLLFFLPLKLRFFPAVLAIVLFTLFVGASAAVVRAAVMGILGLIALQTGRLRHARLLILWTLFFMLAWNPKYLWYDAGFQLSFLAVIGIMEVASPLRERSSFLPDAFGVRDAIIATLAAHVTAVPLIVILFGRMSFVAPLANVFVAPAVPFAMLFGFLATMVSFISFPLGQLLAFAGYGAVEWIIHIANMLSDLPYASVTLPKVHPGFLFSYYGVLALLAIALFVRKYIQKSAA
ncbi:hypothetical protein A3D88_03830 [Candidatus Peribacteria bacterium RIFCSPHIGHO2_02_FULL_52_16]|nr:MAG: hypothetical protein A2706_04645 [Candidatus Peribacteria bacterium RIFCSPHIGHO2_01_FULL_51_35]OGJ61810.1 MAG: hypothetical protein A3D88_03830 [Candidatus Peribacteria bacterium RIFCSPHIGHO2_02_FULL_52_16]